MRHYLCLLVALFLTLGIHAQKTVRMTAVKADNYGVAYSLPKTSINIIISHTKTAKKAGKYYMYAERYLNMSNPITEDEVIFTLDKIEAVAKGVVDKRETFLVEFRPNSASAFLTLTEEGLLCAINDDYTFPKNASVAVVKPKVNSETNVHSYLSEEILRAGSTAKQAELIAKQIYKLRESRNDILTGDADNMPPDGDAYKLVMQQLDEQEKALTELFIGTESAETKTKTIRIEPERRKNIEETVIARFSKKVGVVEANDLSGEAIYFSLKSKDAFDPIVLTLKETIAREKKYAQGIVYNVPGKANLKVEFQNKEQVDIECDVVQYGIQDVLFHKQFGDKNNPLKVIFYPELGAIKETGVATLR